MPFAPNPCPDPGGTCAGEYYDFTQGSVGGNCLPQPRPNSELVCFCITRVLPLTKLCYYKCKTGYTFQGGQCVAAKRGGHSASFSLVPIFFLKAIVRKQLRKRYITATTNT